MTGDTLIAFTGERTQSLWKWPAAGQWLVRGITGTFVPDALPDRHHFAARIPQCVANSANSTRLD